MNIPKLRFPEFAGEWEKKKLGEVAEIITGNTPPTANQDYYNGEYLFVSPFDINDGRWIKETKTTLTKIGFEKGRKIRKGSTLFVCIGSTIGKVGQIDIDCITNQQINSVVSIENDDGFIYTLLENHSPKIKMLAAEQAVPIINKTTFSNYVLSIPSLLEQTRIASFLTAVDSKLQALKKKKSLLEEYKKGVMQKLFSQELRFKPALSEVEGDEYGKDFPQWEVKKLGEVTNKVDKKNKNREILPVYSISNKNGFVPQSEQFEGVDSNERGYDISLYKIIENNTFAYNPARINVGSIGYSGTIGRVIVSSLYVCFKTVQSVNDIFFNYYLNTNHFKDSVISKGEGGVRIYLFYENFSEITINLPSLAEQTRIANFLSSIDEKIQAAQVQIDKMETWKRGLLQKMFV